MTRPKVLLFDLGGVLIEFAGLDEMRSLLARDPGAAAVRQRWIASPAILAFERGAISAEAFAGRFVAEWGLALDPAAFLARFRSWINPPYPGVADLLDALRADFVLACLSNTNEAHWADMLDRHGLRPALDRHYASHLIGAAKPDPAVFAFVTRDLGCAPGEIAFFDDAAENVEAARRAGFQAHLVPRPEGLRAQLGQLGLLGPALTKS